MFDNLDVTFSNRHSFNNYLYCSCIYISRHFRYFQKPLKNCGFRSVKCNSAFEIEIRKLIFFPLQTRPKCSRPLDRQYSTMTKPYEGEARILL